MLSQRTEVRLTIDHCALFLRAGTIPWGSSENDDLALALDNRTPSQENLRRVRAARAGCSGTAVASDPPELSAAPQPFLASVLFRQS